MIHKDHGSWLHVTFIKNSVLSVGMPGGPSGRVQGVSGSSYLAAGGSPQHPGHAV